MLSCIKFDRIVSYWWAVFLFDGLLFSLEGLVFDYKNFVSFKMSILFTFLRLSSPIYITYVLTKFNLLHMLSWFFKRSPSFSCVAFSWLSVYVELGERSQIICTTTTILVVELIWWRTLFQINCEVLNFGRAITISTFGGRWNFLPKPILSDSFWQTYASCRTCRRLNLQSLRLSHIFSPCELKVVISGWQLMLLLMISGCFTLPGARWSSEGIFRQAQIIVALLAFLNM